jgi:hypothetical protein
MLIVSPARADLIINGNFEADPILQAGQSEVLSGQFKAYEPIDNSENFERGISGVVGWEIMPDSGMTGTDNGLAKLENLIAGGSGDLNNQQLYMNRWLSNVFQTVDTSDLTAGQTVRASVDFGTWELNGSRGGWVGLFSSVTNQYVDFALLGNDDWEQSSVDFTVGDRQFGNAFFDYTLTATDLSGEFFFVLGLQNFSTGAIVYDNASLTVISVPEPSAAMATLVAGCVLLMRRKRYPCMQYRTLSISSSRNS